MIVVCFKLIFFSSLFTYINTYGLYSNNYSPNGNNLTLFLNKNVSIRSLEHNLQRDPECTYSANQLVEIMQGKAKLDKFRYYEGKKYIKVVREEYNEREDRWRDTTVHSFIGIAKDILGNVYKPASWKAPATKHIRFNFCNKQDLLFLTDPRCVGWAGGYLYLR